MQPTSSNKASRFLLTPMLAAAFVLAPMCLLSNAQAGGFLDGLQIHFENHTKSSFKIGNSHYRIQIKGQLNFTDLDDDVASLDGYAMFEENRDKKKYRIEFSNDANGKVERHYFVDGREQALDSEGKKWLAAMIPVALRETAIDAKGRVNRLIAKGGADAVLAEVELTHNDYSQRLYLIALCKNATLNPAQQQRLLVASSRIDSDFEVRQVLQSVIKHQSLNPLAQAQLLNRVAKIDSDFEQRQVLIAITPTLHDDADVLAAWQKALAKVDSDFEVRQVLGAFAKRDKLSGAPLEAALQASMKINSDFEHRQVLVALARQMRPENAAQLSAFLKSAQKISSDFERRVTLVSLLEHGKLGKGDYLLFLDALKGMGSDFEVRTILQALAKQMPLDPALVERYRQVASTLGDFERGQAEKSLARLN
ncbi:MAG: hypothetical protein RL748_2584 [Pseudomonadota bacterium]|jgi:hypothetical protein